MKSMVTRKFIVRYVLVCLFFVTFSFGEYSRAQDKTDLEKFTTLSKVENVKRIETDNKGVVRVWIEIDKTHSVIAKFKQIPTELDIKAVRDKTLVQEAEGKASLEAVALKEKEAEDLKALGKCPCCGQLLPKDGGGK